MLIKEDLLESFIFYPFERFEEYSLLVCFLHWPFESWRRSEDPPKGRFKSIKIKVANKSTFIGNHLFIYPWTAFHSIVSFILNIFVNECSLKLIILLKGDDERISFLKIRRIKEFLPCYLISYKKTKTSPDKFYTIRNYFYLVFELSICNRSETTFALEKEIKYFLYLAAI